MADKRSQQKQNKNQIGFKLSKSLQENDSIPPNAIKKEKPIQNLLTKKAHKLLKKFIFPVKPYLNIFLIISMIAIINGRKELISNSNEIILRLNSSNYFINKDFEPMPSKVYIDNIEQESSKWNTKKITINNIYSKIKLEWNSPLQSCSKMFMDLTEILEIDLSGFDSSLVTDTSYMFKGCLWLFKINLDGFTTSAVKTMKEMFFTLPSLESLNISHFKTSQVADMSYLFNKIPKVEYINVSGFDTSSVTNMEGMFGDSGFKYLDLSNFDTRKVENMYVWLLSFFNFN